MKLAADARVALYYVPMPLDPLWQAGSAWLGRDALTGDACAQPDLREIAALTQNPRGYGFHATLKAPFRLRDGIGWDDVLWRVAALSRRQAPFPLPQLKVAAPDGFLALVERERSAPLRGLADVMVEGLDDLRAELSPAEIARRRQFGLSDMQEAMMQRWGYGAVFAMWRFHMTLSRRLTAAQRDHLLPAAKTLFAGICGQPRRVEAVCVFLQRGGNEDFRLAARIPLG